MIEQNFDEAFPPDWVKANIDDVDNELVILRQVIPWQSILDQLVSLYSPGKGRVGKSLRVMVALLMVGAPQMASCWPSGDIPSTTGTPPTRNAEILFR
ncbi:MAG: hypothetical protein ACE1Z4_01840 [Gammaproteobacteria bacterium]